MLQYLMQYTRPDAAVDRGLLKFSAEALDISLLLLGGNL